LTYLDCGQLWQDQFIGTYSFSDHTTDKSIKSVRNKRHFSDISEEESTLVEEDNEDTSNLEDAKIIDTKKRRMSANLEESRSVHSYANTIDKYVFILKNMCHSLLLTFIKIVYRLICVI
jgi:hypothetical protein